MTPARNDPTQKPIGSSEDFSGDQTDTGKNPSGSQNPSRRDFLKWTGAALAGGWTTLRLPPRVQADNPTEERKKIGLPERPNLVFLITDQTRFPQHWPDNWVADNLPNRKRLMDKGLSFNRAYCNSSMCSPSRATLFTGLYPTHHGVQRTLTYGGSLSPSEKTLSAHIQNMARMLASAGYTVVFKGKWHLSKSAAGELPTKTDLEAFGFSGWQPTSAGEGMEMSDYGGGCADNDRQIVEGFDSDPTQGALDFLADAPPTPFALIVSLANPHDLLSYPKTWNADNGTGCFNYKGQADFTQGIDLPVSIDETLNTKPTAQQQSLLLYKALGELQSPLEKKNYVNFYAYLHKRADQEIGKVLNALDTAGLTPDTIIIHTSDHGEMGLAHGGLRQKMFNAYEECIHIPLIFSNPTFFPTPATTSSLASLVDLMPTVATLAKVPLRERWTFQGYDLSPILADPGASVQDALLYTFDDENAGLAEPQNIVKQPNHIRCIREGDWKYARYFDPSGLEPEQYELYNLLEDPNELANRAGNPAYSADQGRLKNRLAEMESSLLNTRLYLPVIIKG